MEGLEVLTENVTEELEKTNLQENQITSDSEFTDARSSVLKEYLKKYILPGIDNDIAGETLLTHSSYLNENDVRIIQWLKHSYQKSADTRRLLLNEKAMCEIVNYADRKMQDLQINGKDVTPKEMENIIKKSIKYATYKIEKTALVDYSNMKWYMRLKAKILKYFYEK